MPYRTAVSAAQNWQNKFKKVRLAYKRGDKPYEYGVKEAGENYGMVKFRNKTYTVTYQGNAKEALRSSTKNTFRRLANPASSSNRRKKSIIGLSPRPVKLPAQQPEQATLPAHTA